MLQDMEWLFQLLTMVRSYIWLENTAVFETCRFALPLLSEVRSPQCVRSMNSGQKLSAVFNQDSQAYKLTSVIQHFYQVTVLTVSMAL